VVDANGRLLGGHDSVDWGCSHSWNTRMTWDDATNHFSMVCATDRGGGIAQPNDPGHLLYTSRDLATLSVGDVVADGDGGYWITNNLVFFRCPQIAGIYPERSLRLCGYD